MGVFARQFPALGDTPCFRRPDEIPQDLAPNHDVSSGYPAESEVGTLRPLIICRVSSLLALQALPLLQGLDGGHFKVK